MACVIYRETLDLWGTKPQKTYLYELLLCSNTHGHYSLCQETYFKKNRNQSNRQQLQKINMLA